MSTQPLGAIESLCLVCPVAHPNIRLFITHGGLLSTQETMQRGVPLLGIPIFGDQSLNMNRAAAAGCGLVIQFTMSPRSLCCGASEKYLTTLSKSDDTTLCSNYYCYYSCSLRIQQEMQVINSKQKIRLAVCQIDLCMLKENRLFFSSYTLNVPVFFISFSLMPKRAVCSAVLILYRQH